ncbi:phytanoyl-dioxygenase family protein [Coniochaeta sp. 2T2.1]|nr:phytanoyl-dioxygenase family protein [Coniochaeta sp. 2T2.1]
MVPATAAEDLSKITDDRLRPLPDLQVFESGTATTEEVIAAMIKTGAVIIRNAVDEKTLDLIEADTRPYLGDYHKGRDNDEDKLSGFFSKESKRVLGLATKSKIYMDAIAQHPIFKAVRDELLTAHFKFWIGNKLNHVSSPPWITNTIIFSVQPGSATQDLHRDDVISHNPCRRKTAEQYTQGQDTAIGFFVAAKPSTKKNGATRFIPGSHLWENDTPPDEKLTVQAELNRGDAFMFLASCYHGASANNTTDEERLLYSTFYCKGTLRQEENQYIANPYEELTKMNYDDSMLHDIGYGVNQPFSGYVDFKHPLEYLRGEEWSKEKAGVNLA